MFNYFEVNAWVRWMLENGAVVPEEWLNLVTDPSLMNIVKDEWRSISRGELFRRAKTLRERAFARLVGFIQDDPDVGHTITFYHKAHTNATEKFPLPMEIPPTLTELMAYCQEHPGIYRDLADLPLTQGDNSVSRNKEVIPALQDLADAVTWEGSEAFVAPYYPGVQDIEPLTDEHVRWVMLAMQREVNREAYNSRAAQFLDLPFERQVALAERRRLWFARFGITPTSWPSETWNLWEVSNEITFPPDGYYCGWDDAHPTNNAYTLV